MASSKVDICLKKKNPPEHKYSVTFVSKVGTKMRHQSKQDPTCLVIEAVSRFESKV